ncbi:hypothetical protein HYN69_10540 [Gemmobacter aquarius]|uniref:Uncharacterized protein n=2 Tax=Paragemmobacter aquarius TaxID=2169400 RepID=A0A2S0UM59_9RHOB|nr:hypothetical protein HYN69_10540 [Gemmobacter aquarius]
MEIRNPKFNRFGSIDCEILHPEFGWIPFTASETDVEKAGQDIYRSALEMQPAEFVAGDPLPIERAAMRASRFQAKAALYQAGLLPTVERLLSQSENFMHKLAWDEAGEFYRDSPTIAHLAGAMDLDDLAVDELFRLAMSIRA